MSSSAFSSFESTSSFLLCSSVLSSLSFVKLKSFKLISISLNLAISLFFLCTSSLVFTKSSLLFSSFLFSLSLFVPNRASVSLLLSSLANKSSFSPNETLTLTFCWHNFSSYKLTKLTIFSLKNLFHSSLQYFLRQLTGSTSSFLFSLLLLLVRLILKNISRALFPNKSLPSLIKEKLPSLALFLFNFI